MNFADSPIPFDFEARLCMIFYKDSLKKFANDFASRFCLSSELRLILGFFVLGALS